MRACHRLTALALALSLALSGPAAPRPSLAAGAAAPAAGPVSYRSAGFFFPPYRSGADRMGVAGPVGSYNAVLGAGWYQDWDAPAAPAHPDGMEYARTLRFTVTTNSCGTGKIPAATRAQVTPSLSGAALADNLRAHPGALWIIGNEPDSIYNCSPILPALYAALYHEFYTLIKAADPLARVAIAAIVQPSPLRLAYLDQVRAAYQAAYGQALPVDVWNIHLYAFPEVAGQAGAGVPPGATTTTGWTYTWAQTVDLDVLAANLRAMRQWLADRGQRDKPLIITEFGQLMPDNGTYTLDGLTFTAEVSRDYLAGSVHHFLTATDPALGYPADGNRLVQLWAWYSLRDPYYGGNLLMPNSQPTLAGQAFAQLSAQQAAAYLDAYPVPVAAPSLAGADGSPMTVTLQAEVDNHGTAGAAVVPARLARYDAATGVLLDSQAVSAGPVPARYAGARPALAGDWLIAPGSLVTLTLELDPAQALDQARRSPQTLSYRVGYVPDLALGALAAQPGARFLWAGPTTVTFTAQVSNLGYLASPPASVRFRLADLAGAARHEQTLAVPALAPGAAAAVSAAVPVAEPGRYVLAATVLPGAGPDLLGSNDALALPVMAARGLAFFPAVAQP